MLVKKSSYGTTYYNFDWSWQKSTSELVLFYFAAEISISYVFYLSLTYFHKN